MTRTVLSASWRRTSRVPSLLPSSTITISRSTGSSTARIRRTISTTVLRSSNTGTITDSLWNAFVASGDTKPPVPVVRAGETLAELDARTPTEHALGEGDVGPTLLRVVGGERLEP